MTFDAPTQRICWLPATTPKIPSERLGYSKLGITVDLYSDVMPGMQDDAVAKVDPPLKEAQKRR
jgi:hypothetical protein